MFYSEKMTFYLTKHLTNEKYAALMEVASVWAR